MWKTPPGAAPEPALLPLVKQSDHPCHGCAKCCLYVAIEIDSPTSLTEYDWEGQWYVKFDTRCMNLTPNGLCGIYERRPAICKDFDWRECENHMTPEEGPPDKWLWETADAFLAWFEKQRPKAFRRYRAYMKKKHRAAEKAELLRVGTTA
jgi:hypothetical protein